MEMFEQSSREKKAKACSDWQLLKKKLLMVVIATCKTNFTTKNEFSTPEKCSIQVLVCVTGVKVALNCSLKPKGV